MLVWKTTGMRSILLTSIQFTCMGVLLFINPMLTTRPFLAGIQISGILLGVWAIMVMSRSRLNVTPVPLKGATLITTGPYKLIRHPMYTAVLLVLAPVPLSHPNTINILVFTILLVNLIFKLTYEEKLLRERFEGYGALMQRTWRLVPYIY